MKEQSKFSFLVNLFLGGLCAIFLAAAALVWKRNAATPLEYFIPMTFLLYSFALVFLSALLWSFENQCRLVLVSIALFGGLLLSEITLSAMGMSNPHNSKIYRERVAAQLGIPFDARDKYQVVADFQKDRKDAWPNIGPQYFVETNGLAHQNHKVFPLGGISKSFIVVCNEVGKFSTYHSDEHGFNNPLGLYQPDKVDFMIIGDSFAHGACVEEGQDVASLLRQHGYPHTLTMGSNGIGPLIELANLSEYGPQLKPKKVLWFYYEGNDLPDLSVEAKSPYLFSYFDDHFSQGLFAKQPLVDASLKEYIALKKDSLAAQYHSTKLHTSLLSVLKLQNLRSQLMLNQEKAEPFMSPKGLFESILITANKRVNSWGGELIFVYLPEYARYQSKNPNQFNQTRHKEEILNIAASLGLKTIDVDQAFKQHADPLSLFPLRIGGHYTPEGYQLVSDEIVKLVQS